METGKRHIKSGKVFNHLFNRPKGKNITVKKAATLKDTIVWMKKVVFGTQYQTKRIAKKLQGASVKETCSKVWNFCFSHFQYQKDEERKEQIRTPFRSWWDRKQGIDCDCLTVFISSILTNLKIPHFWRMARYSAQNMEHIYPVAIGSDGQEIIIDCVVHKFNYEVEYTEKEDVMTELQILNGVNEQYYEDNNDSMLAYAQLPIDAQDLFMRDGNLDGIRDFLKRRRETRTQRKEERKNRREEFKKLPRKEKVKRVLSKGLNVVNKANPAAALLRAGVLASMKLNLFKVASHLRFAYWTPQQAHRKNMNMTKFRQLQEIYKKVEKIYFGAGGKPEALKKAILTGRGNASRMVALNGLGSIDRLPDDYDSLSKILGEDLYFSETDGLNENQLNGLGEVATGTAIATASGFIATIAALIKKLDGLFNRGSLEQKQMDQQNALDDANDKNRPFSIKQLRNFISKQTNPRSTADNVKNLSMDDTIDIDNAAENDPFQDIETIDTSQTNTRTIPEDDTSDTEKKKEKEEGGFVNWVKNNALLVGIGAAVLVGGGGYLIYRNTQNKKTQKALNGASSLSGTKSQKSRKGKRKLPKTKLKANTRAQKSTVRKVKLS